MEPSHITDPSRVWELLGNWTAALAACATVVMAYSVQREARKIRSLDAYTKVVEYWQHFNQQIIDHPELAERWSRIRSGELRWAEIGQPDLNLIYTFFNVLAYEYKCWREGWLPKSYTEKSVHDNLNYFQYIWDDLAKHLLTDGWPVEFQRYANEHMGNRRRELELARKK